MRSALHAGELDIAMHGHPEGRHELPVEMEFRKGGDPAHRFQVQIAVEMLVDIIQHPLHPGMIVLKRRLHRPFLRGDQLGAYGHVALDRSCGLEPINRCLPSNGKP